MFFGEINMKIKVWRYLQIKLLHALKILFEITVMLKCSLLNLLVLKCYWNRIFLSHFIFSIDSFKHVYNHDELYFCQILTESAIFSRFFLINTLFFFCIIFLWFTLPSIWSEKAFYCSNTFSIWHVEDWQVCSPRLVEHETY